MVDGHTVVVRPYEGGVVEIMLDRPEVRNAVDRETADALFEAFAAFELAPAQRVAVLVGSGGNFCSGADLGAFYSEDENRRNRLNLDMSLSGPMGPTRMKLHKPVIAAVSGYAVAGGLELALWCDLRVADESSVFGVFCRSVGVPLIDGGTQRLPRLIGRSRALDMILTGRAVGGEEAFAMGLVNRLAERGKVREASLALAQQLAQLPQECMRRDRASVLAGEGVTCEEGMKAEFSASVELVDGSEMRDGVSRFLSGSRGRGSVR